jgi:hypothetical protein
MKGIASTGALKTLLGGWMDGWMEGKAGLRIAYSNQKLVYMNINPGVDFIKNKIAVHYINPGKFKSRLTPN